MEFMDLARSIPRALAKCAQSHASKRKRIASCNVAFRAECEMQRRRGCCMRQKSHSSRRRLVAATAANLSPVNSEMKAQ
jgi:hypothetical protein